MEPPANRSGRHAEHHGDFGGGELLPRHKQEDLAIRRPKCCQRSVKRWTAACCIKIVVDVVPRIGRQGSRILAPRVPSLPTPVSAYHVPRNPVEPWPRIRPAPVVALHRPQSLQPYLPKQVVRRLMPYPARKECMDRSAMPIEHVYEALWIADRPRHHFGIAQLHALASQLVVSSTYCTMSQIALAPLGAPGTGSPLFPSEVAAHRHLGKLNSESVPPACDAQLILNAAPMQVGRRHRAGGASEASWIA